MTLQQFKQALIDMGYKEKDYMGNYTEYKKRNKEVCVQDLFGINIYFDIERKGYSIELRQFSVKDFKKALANIKKFERKIGR